MLFQKENKVSPCFFDFVQCRTPPRLRTSGIEFFHGQPQTSKASPELIMLGAEKKNDGFYLGYVNRHKRKEAFFLFAYMGLHLVLKKAKNVPYFPQILLQAGSAFV